jgi:hypothetical protein
VPEGQDPYAQVDEEEQDDEEDLYEEEDYDEGGEQEEGSSEMSSEPSYYMNKEFATRRWQWAYPVVDGVNPCPRGGHSATLSGHSIVIFGGHYYRSKEEGYMYLNDTFLLDVSANKFNKAKTNGTPPAPRYGHSAILAGSRIIIFGGKGEKEKVFRDLHALDPATLTWYQGPEGIGSPSARFGHSANLVGNSKMLIFGGWNGKDYFNDVYILDLEVMAWSQPQCSGKPPTPRQGHTAVQMGKSIIIQGGFCFNEERQKEAGFRQGTELRECYYNEVRILNLEKYEWVRLRVSGTPPLPRFGHTANVSLSDIVYFGGWSLNSGAKGMQNFVAPQDIDYFIVLNTDADLRWEKGIFEGQAPLSRYGHTATSIGPHILIFGGWEFSRASNEVVVLRDLSSTSKEKK